MSNLILSGPGSRERVEGISRFDVRNGREGVSRMWM